MSTLDGFRLYLGLVTAKAIIGISIVVIGFGLWGAVVVLEKCAEIAGARHKDGPPRDR